MSYPVFLMEINGLDPSSSGTGNGVLLNFEFRVSSFESRVSSLEFRVSSFEFRVSSFEYRVSSLKNKKKLM